jgi:Family of unknown function (DUF6390)
MTLTASGWEAFAAYAYPPNELGYCGPPDSSVLLTGSADEVGGHARGFDGAWPYLEEIASAGGRGDPLAADVVRGYWVGGPVLERVSPEALLTRLRHTLAGQPRGLLDDVTPGPGVLAHHSFHVFVVYPWVRFLDGHADSATPLRILQQCRIRWGVVQSVDERHALIASRPLAVGGGELYLDEPVLESVRWRGSDGTRLAPRPVPGQTVAAHWDWVCGELDGGGADALAEATASTLGLVNRLRAG